ncbi:MAG TPA: S-adenosylmethionine:tRNA ribosyltransferase-isomerase [Streptosporangiaceae bacterium]|nr:S-adenosylmethionine:tRNA ribosyltransferase-isomerase [Streptosporangiaceae bacterium]
MRRPASSPPEARGLGRDGVRLLVASPDGVLHAGFPDLPRFLAPGDLLVVNTSATLAAAVPGRRPGGRPVLVHWSGRLEDGTWLVELRTGEPALARVTDAAAGETISLTGGATVTLRYPYPGPGLAGPARPGPRMWAAVTDADVAGLAARHGQPVRYGYVPDRWPLSAYQTVFARAPGSAEMPSAARPFTPDLVTELISAGVLFATVTLHAGVASLEAGETPLPERFTVPPATADLVNLTRAAGRRVVAVGTTSTRAVESAAQASGGVRASDGLTELVLGPARPARVVTGLITGWHDEGASHLDLLTAVAGPGLVQAAYQEAERAGYLWHEFGDSCLLLPPARASRRAT